jgi:hypothetical protein
MYVPEAERVQSDSSGHKSLASTSAGRGEEKGGKEEEALGGTPRKGKEQV